MVVLPDITVALPPNSIIQEETIVWNHGNIRRALLKILERLGRFFDSFIWITAVASGIIAAGIALLIDYEVFMRYALNIGQGWVIEIINNLLLYMTFLGVAWLLKEGGHVSMTAVYSRLGPRARLLDDLIVTAVCAIACVFMTWYSLQISVESIQSGTQEATILGAPKGVILAIIPFGFLMLTIQHMRNFYGFLKRWRA